MQFGKRVKNLVNAFKGKTVSCEEYKEICEISNKAKLQVCDKEKEIASLKTNLAAERETNRNYHNDNVQLTADNVELLAKNQTLTKHCNDLINRVETMKRDMNTQIQFMGLINTAVNQLCDGIKELPERMESIEKGYLNPLPTEDVPE